MNWFLFVTLLIYKILYCLVRAFYSSSCLTQIFFHLPRNISYIKYTQFFYNFFPGIPNDSNYLLLIRLVPEILLHYLFNFLKKFPRERRTRFKFTYRKMNFQTKANNDNIRNREHLVSIPKITNCR